MTGLKHSLLNECKSWRTDILGAASLTPRLPCERKVLTPVRQQRSNSRRRIRRFFSNGVSHDSCNYTSMVHRRECLGTNQGDAIQWCRYFKTLWLVVNTPLHSFKIGMTRFLVFHHHSTWKTFWLVYQGKPIPVSISSTCGVANRKLLLAIDFVANINFRCCGRAVGICCKLFVT